MADKKPTYIESVRDAVSQHLNSVREHMKTMQPTPVDTRERSAREQRDLWARVNALPGDLRENMMGQMAFRAGHKDGEPMPCEWCQYVVRQAGGS